MLDKVKKIKIGFAVLYIIIVIAIIFFMSYHRGFVEGGSGGYYSTSSLAMKHSGMDEKKGTLKDVIKIVWLNDKPIYLYVSTSGHFCYAEFSKKKIKGKIRWKEVSHGRLLPPIKDLDKSKTIPYKTGVNIRLNNLLIYGVTRSTKANTIRINGIKPKFKEFFEDGNKYILWYTTSIKGPVYLDELHFTTD